MKKSYLFLLMFLASSIYLLKNKYLIVLMQLMLTQTIGNILIIMVDSIIKQVVNADSALGWINISYPTT